MLTVAIRGGGWGGVEVVARRGVSGVLGVRGSIHISISILTKIQTDIAAIPTMTVLTMTRCIYSCSYTCYGYTGFRGAPRAYCGYTLTYLLTHGQGMCTRWGGAVARRDASGVLGLRVGLWEGLRQGQVYIYTHMCIYRDIYLYLCRVANTHVCRCVCWDALCAWATGVQRQGARAL